MKRLFSAIAFSTVLVACQTPVTPALDAGLVVDKYPTLPGAEHTNAADMSWRTVFVDPRLRLLVELALDTGRPLRRAVLDAEAARAQLQVANGQLWPRVDLSGEYSRSRANGDASVSRQALSVSDRFGVGLQLTAFEIDLFGRLKAESESAFADYLAAEEGVLASRITLVAAVAEAYIATLSANEQLSLVQSTLKDWRQSEALTRRMYDAGQIGGDELAQAEAQVRSVEADLEAMRRNSAIAGNALALAVGRRLPNVLPVGLQLADGPVLTSLPAGAPSHLLIRRPDIRRLERQLEAAHANVRAARAAFFPSFSLTGQLGDGSSELEDLFGQRGPTWSFAPRITVPIFHGGDLRGRLDLAAIRASATVINYEEAIQRAFTEVSDGLAGRETFDRQIEMLAASVSANERRVQFVQARFQAGVVNRLDLLDAQRQLYASQQGLVQLRSAQASASIALYRALGGGSAG